MNSLKAQVYRLLRWTEKYTKTDMVYLAKGGFWLSLGHVFQIASGLLLAIAFANLVPKETYGTYQFIMSAAGIISALSLTGMSTAITRAVAQGSEGALRAGFHTYLAWSPIMALAGVILAFYYYLNGNQILFLSFLVVGALSPFVSGFGLNKSYLIGKQLFRESMLLGFWRKFLPILSILLAIYLTQDVVIIVLAYFASNAISAGLLYLLVIRRYHLPKTEEQEMISYGKHLSLLTLLSELATQADKVLIFHFLGAVPLAAYSLAQLPVNHMRSISKLLLSLTFPKLSMSDFPNLKKTLPYKTRIFFIATLIGVAIYILTAPILFSVLFPAYPESVIISQVLALIVLASPRSLYGQALTAHEKKRELYILSLSQNFVKILLLLALLPFFGLWGAVYSVLTTHLYGVFITRYLFSKARA